MPSDFAKAAADRQASKKLFAELTAGLTKATGEMKKAQSEAEKTKKELSGEADE